VKLRDKALVIAWKLNCGDYPAYSRRLKRDLPPLDPKECALKALDRLEKGHSRAELQKALDEAVAFLEKALALFEKKYGYAYPGKAAEEEFASDLGRRFPEFSPESRRSAATFGVLWYCK
jgi:hypothetical protein